MRRPSTWVLEQGVLMLLLLPSVVATIIADLSARGLLRAVVGCVGAIAAQKIRSGADRQREQDVLAGYAPAHMECAKRIAWWSAFAQELSVMGLIASATTPQALLAGLPPLAFAVLYGSWRRWYRRRWPALPERPWGLFRAHDRCHGEVRS